jgi:hypothetical protein
MPSCEDWSAIFSQFHRGKRNSLPNKTIAPPALDRSRCRIRCSLRWPAAASGQAAGFALVSGRTVNGRQCPALFWEATT